MSLRSRLLLRASPLANSEWPRFPVVAFVVGYCFLLLCIPSQLVVAHFGAPGTPANLWGVCGLLWWCCATLAGMNPVRGFTPLRVTAGLLTFCVLASYTNAMATGWYVPPGLHQTSDDIPSLLVPTISAIHGVMVSAANRGLISFACWLGVALLAGEGLRSWRDVDRVVGALTWFGAFVAALGFVQYFWGVDIAGYFRIPGLVANSDFGAVSTRSVLNRVSSTAIHPIEYGVVLAAVFPLSLHWTLWRWGRKLALLPTTLIGVGMLLSVSRSAVLVITVELIVLFVGWPRQWRRRSLTIFPIALVLTRLAFPGLLGTVYSLFHNLGNDPSIDGRTQDYGVVFEVYSQHAIFGRGLYTFVPTYYRILDNQLLVFLLELGAAGLVAILLFFLTASLCGRSAYRFASGPEHRSLGLCLSASVLGLLVGYATFDAWSFPMAGGITFVLAGLAHGVWRLTDAETGGAPSLRARRGVLWRNTPDARV